MHTLLRLPAGIFYAQGVKANVLFFERKPAEVARTRELWVYDLCTNQRFTPKQNPPRREHLTTSWSPTGPVRAPVGSSRNGSALTEFAAIAESPGGGRER